MEVFEFLFGQYLEYSPLQIALELVAISAGIVSVLYSKKNNVMVYPFGLISTAIFVYLLYHWELVGDMIINGYYFVMSLYGWYKWSNGLGADAIKISKTNKMEWLKSLGLFTASTVFVYVIYIQFEMLKGWINYVDILTTGIAFVGMWLMALRKLEHWLVLLVANVVSIPLYFIKGYTFTSFLYIFLTVIAYLGYISWKRNHFKTNLTA